MEQNPLIQVTSSPHIRSNFSVRRIMGDVLIGLLPATALAIYFFEWDALFLVLVCVLAAMASEAVVQLIRKQPIRIKDLSAAVTGLLLALNLPPTAPLWMAALGSIFAIVVVKQLFGGLGQNFMNPALGGRVFLVISYPLLMGNYIAPLNRIGDIGADAVTYSTDALTYATPLALLKSGSTEIMPSFVEGFLGNVGGSLGETSALALLIGGLYLLIRKVISWEIPVIYIATVFCLSFALYGFDLNVAAGSIVFGGLMLGAFFMATDYASSPINMKGRIIYAFFLGVLTVLIRRFGGYPEGVMFAIIIMNAFTPAIESLTRSKTFGGSKK